jgi:hypothetical protein
MKTSDQWVKCVSSGTGYYTVGHVYQVHSDGKDRYVVGSDGLYDNMRTMVSKFIPHKEPSDENF